MQKLIKLLIVAFCCSASWAFPLSLDFRNASVVEVVQTLVSEVLRRDYVLSPEVTKLEKRVTVLIREIDNDKLLSVIEDVFAMVGVQVTDRDGVLYIEIDQASGTGGGQGACGPGGCADRRESLMSSIAAQRGGGELPSPTSGGLPGSLGKRQEAFEVIESYRPRGRSVEFLGAVATAAGVTVIGSTAKADVLVYGGSKEFVERIRGILEEVDTPPASVSVRAVLIEFTDGSTTTHSLNVALTALAGKLGLVFNAGVRLAGNSLVWQTGSLNAVLSAIDGDSRFRYIAEPMIKVVDGEQAKFIVGSEQPTRAATTSDNSGNVQQSIDYKSAGVQIDLEPRVFADHVRLKISQQVSSFSLTTTSNIDSPTILKRAASTTVAVRPGELIVLAGMDERRDSASTSGLFFLPDFLRGTNREDTRSQLILLLEVHVDDLIVPAPTSELSASDIDSFFGRV
jgi:type II secretory pathway component GspD/PulD (secretin)